MSSQARKVKQLQTDASALVRAGEQQRALEKFAQLELLEPREPDWPRRAAECHRLLGESEQHLDALARAGKAYVAMGLVVKAIAICKMMLAVDARNQAALAWLSELRSPGAQAPIAPARPSLFKQKEAQPSAEPKTPTVMPAPSAARSLVAKKGLVAVARMVARTAPRQPPKLSSRSVEPPPPAPEPADSVVSPSLPARAPDREEPVIEDVAPIELQHPALTDGPTEFSVGDAPAASAVVSLPPLAVEADLRLLVPGSSPWPEDKTPSSGMFPLAIDAAGPTVEEQALQQARGILPAIPLFAEMDPHTLEGLVKQSRIVHLRGGDVVFKQDDAPDCLYVVVNGNVAMFDEAVNVELYRVGEHEFFGESALLGNELQPATARAVEDSDLLAFSRDSVRSCIVDNLSMVPVLLRFLRSRMLEHLVRTSPLFAHLDTAERRALSRKFEFIEMSEGATLIQQGTRSSGLFVLLSGAVDVVQRDGDREHWLATLERGGMFGEISLLGHSPAEADVRSVTSGFALMLPAAAFRDVIMTHPPVLEVLTAISEERKQANERRRRPGKRDHTRRSPADAPR